MLPLEQQTWSAILGSTGDYRNLCAVVLSGGVGGARLSRGLAEVVDGDCLTIAVNVGDDDDIYGVRVCADLDTVTYTLAGIEGPHGWGVAGDTHTTMDHLSALGVDTTFRLGDRDLATCLARTSRLAAGEPLSQIVRSLAEQMGVTVSVVPATDDELRTRILTADGTWRSFQDYFVTRAHRDEVDEVVYEGAITAAAAPGLVDAITAADVVFIAPSNPILSIWPILAVPDVRRAVTSHGRVIAVSPLFGGAALKGPAAELLVRHGYPEGNEGILMAYEGLITDLVVDEADAADVDTLADGGVRIHAVSTRMIDPAEGVAFARWICDLAAGTTPVR